jgi:hypothetical protein
MLLAGVSIECKLTGRQLDRQIKASRFERMLEHRTRPATAIAAE